jgi:hypothetical protein
MPNAEMETMVDSHREYHDIASADGWDHWNAHTHNE